MDPKVDVASIVHASLRSLIEKIEREHGLRINSMSVDWTIVESASARPKGLLRSITIETTS
jgi:hypothetical protein